MNERHTYSRKKTWLMLSLLSLLILLVAACGGSTGGPTAQATPTQAPVNGFGIAANHVHAMLALPGNVLILATHYGLFRSADSGKSWQQVAGNSSRVMHNSMTYSLGVSPLNPQRLYVLTLPAVYPYGTLGLYTSADQGKTWTLASAASSLTSSSIYLETPGNDNPNEVYIYLPDLGNAGLRVSMDDGQHFTTTGALPFGNILGLLAIPNSPGHLLAYGDSGVALSTDGGAHWQTIKGITGGVSDMTTAGPHSPIYASGDSGIMASNDEGNSFKLVNAQASYASLAVSPAQTQVLYGKTGLVTYRSTDGGRTWSALPHISGNLAVLAVNPDNASLLYLSLSYPTAVYQLTSNTTAWQSLTPPISPAERS